jgi:hypothetical protein
MNAASISLNSSSLHCSLCSRTLPPQSSGSAACPACAAPYALDVFPRLAKGPVTYLPPDDIASEDDAECYFCEGKAAAVDCAHCGLLLCHRCDIPVGDRHLCLKCIDRERANGEAGRFSERHVRFDHLAFGLAFFPLIIPGCIFLTFATAPAALILSIRFWKRPLSAAPSNRAWFGVSMLLSLVQIAAWLMMVVWIGVLLVSQ